MGLSDGGGGVLALTVTVCRYEDGVKWVRFHLEI